MTTNAMMPMVIAMTASYVRGNGPTADGDAES
jgi:hypothetical protein